MQICLIHKQRYSLNKLQVNAQQIKAKLKFKLRQRRVETGRDALCLNCFANNRHLQFINCEFLHRRDKQYTDCDYFERKCCWRYAAWMCASFNWVRQRWDTVYILITCRRQCRVKLDQPTLNWIVVQFQFSGSVSKTFSGLGQRYILRLLLTLQSRLKLSDFNVL